MTTWQAIVALTYCGILVITVATCITGRPRWYYRILDVLWDQFLRPSRWAERRIADRRATRGQDS